MEMEDAVEVLPSSASCMISASGQMEMEDAVWCYQARGGGQAGMLLLLPRQAAGRSSPTREVCPQLAFFAAAGAVAAAVGDRARFAVLCSTSDTA